MKVTSGNRRVTWNLEFVFDETDDETRAKASLEIEGTTLTGWGRARRNPVDPRVPRIGEELAAARALSDLSHQLLDVAAVEIEQFSSREVHLHL
jgi:hypothetical protein